MSSPSTTIEPPLANSGSPETGKRLPNSVLAMIIFVVTEIMFFAALMSAHTIARATVMGGIWPPAGQPRLPVERTAINTTILLLSGALLLVASRRARVSYAKALPYVAGAIATGIAFVLLQGVEWVALLREGLTMTSSAPRSVFLSDRRSARATRGSRHRRPRGDLFSDAQRDALAFDVRGHASILVFRCPAVAGNLFARVFVRGLCVVA